MAIPFLPLLLAVAASLGWAGFDLLRKLLVRDRQPDVPGERKDFFGEAITLWKTLAVLLMAAGVAMILT